MWLNDATRGAEPAKRSQMGFGRTMRLVFIQQKISSRNLALNQVREAIGSNCGLAVPLQSVSYAMNMQKARLLRTGLCIFAASTEQLVGGLYRIRTSDLYDVNVAL